MTAPASICPRCGAWALITEPVEHQPWCLPPYHLQAFDNDDPPEGI